MSAIKSLIRGVLRVFRGVGNWAEESNTIYDGENKILVVEKQKESIEEIYLSL